MMGVLRLAARRLRADSRRQTPGGVDEPGALPVGQIRRVRDGYDTILIGALGHGEQNPALIH